MRRRTVPGGNCLTCSPCIRANRAGPSPSCATRTSPPTGNNSPPGGTTTPLMYPGQSRRHDRLGRGASREHRGSGPLRGLQGVRSRQSPSACPSPWRRWVRLPPYGWRSIRRATSPCTRSRPRPSDRRTCPDTNTSRWSLREVQEAGTTTTELTWTTIRMSSRVGIALAPSSPATTCSSITFAAREHPFRRPATSGITMSTTVSSGS